VDWAPRVDLVDSTEQLLQSTSSALIGVNLADGIGLMMIISRHTRWRSWIGKTGLNCCMVARVSFIEGGGRNEADEIVVMPPSALAKLCTSPLLLEWSRPDV
jgi:hypothetical protein